MILNRAPLGVLMKVLEVEAGAAMKRHLQQLGIQPGALISVDQHAPFGGPTLIRHQGTRFALGQGLAKQIRVASAS